MLTPVLPLHLGALHPVEQALTLVLAFGPFLLLGLVVWMRRREDDRIDAEDDEQPAERDQVTRASRPPPAAGP